MAAEPADTAIDRFISKSHELTAPPPGDAPETAEDWDSIASGVDPNDYQPKYKPIPSILPPPGQPTDTGRVPNSFLMSSKKDIEDYFATPGVCGLVNLGDAIPVPIDESEIKPTEEEAPANDKIKETKVDISVLSRGHVSARFSSLMKKIWAGQFSAVVPQNFKTTIGIIHSQFGGFRQQDCQEFLALLLDTLNEDINHKKQGITNSIITDTFQGELKSEVTCCVCGHVSTKYDPFVYLSVPLPHSNERQIDIYWSQRTDDNTRRVIKLLLSVPIVGTIEDVKQTLCTSILEGVITPNEVTIAHVKNHYIESTLANSLAIKHINNKDYHLYAFHTEVTPTVVTPTSVNPPSNEGYTLLSNDSSDVAMETDPAPTNDPWQPIKSDEGLLAKIARSQSEDETAPLLSETETMPLLTKAEATPLLLNEPKVIVMEWHSCVICLEEMVDSELVTHVSCGAMLCSTCIEASQRHSANETGHMPCPVCQSMVLPAEQFVPMATPDTSQSIVKLLQITILFRNEVSSEDKYTLFGHPCVLNVPSNGTVDLYYQIVSPLAPIDVPWSLAFTDGKGLYCSRCIYGSGCRGCVLNNTMKDVIIKPGDHLTLCFANLTSDNLQEAEGAILHPSLESRWETTISLQDCLDLFAQKETLGSDNPWWCPICNKNQSAIRHLTISQLPSTLIVHLKRFLFHGNIASKVDTGVTFPHSLSFSQIANTSPVELSLISCVCHFGSLNSGHYTAYSKHPVTNNWYYYNDESLTELAPSDRDKESVYILFYNKQSSNAIDLPTERGGVFPSEEEELVQLEPLLRTLKPKPHPLPPPSLPIKKSSSTGNLGNIDDVQLQQQIAASIGIHTTSPVATNMKSSSSNPSLVDSLLDSAVILKSVQLKAFDV